MTRTTIVRGGVAAALIGIATIGAGPASAQTPAPPEGQAPAPAAPAQPPAQGQQPAAAPETQPVKLTRSQTKTLQRRLRVHADGAVGARTRAALKRYQAKSGLQPTGRPNVQTLKAMKLPFAGQVAPKPAAPVTAPAGAAAAAIQAARGQIGSKYASAGASPGAFDCSGLTMWAFKQAGVDLPHSSFDQYKLGTEVPREAIQPGDLVFFDSAGPGASDVGIATGPDTVVSATTKGVSEHSSTDSYWGGHFVGARRLSG